MTCYESGPFACRTGETPKPVVWSYACPSYEVNETGTANSDQEPGLSDELLEAVTVSFEEWNQVPCSRMQMNFAGRTGVSAAEFNQESRAQNVNLVVWREENWNQVASNSTFALTSVSYNPQTGEIADADVEINAEIYQISVTDPVEANAVDLRNTLVHEIGHFIGLDHSSIAAATMYRSADIGETDKRTLHQDDIDAICHVYPALASGAAVCEEPPRIDCTGMNCDDDDGGCCATTRAPAPTGFTWIFAAAGLLVAAGWRRRYSSTSQTQRFTHAQRHHETGNRRE